VYGNSGEGFPEKMENRVGPIFPHTKKKVMSKEGGHAKYNPKRCLRSMKITPMMKEEVR